jgi:hypothetical protein
MRIISRAGMGCFLLLVFVFCLPATTFAKFSTEVPPPEVIQVAKAGLAQFLGGATGESLEMFGFLSTDSLNKTALAAHFKIHMISDAGLKNYAAGRSVETIVEDGGHWYFPVTVKGDERAFLVVGKVRGEWQAISFGFGDLAKEMGKVRKQWPRFRGYHPQYIAAPSAFEFFFTVPEKGPDNMTSMIAPPTSAAGVADYRNLEKAAVAVERVKTNLKRNHVRIK